MLVVPSTFDSITYMLNYLPYSSIPHCLLPHASNAHFRYRTCLVRYSHFNSPSVVQSFLGGSVVESLTGDANILGRRSSYEVVEARSSRMSLENIEAVGGAEPEWESANAKLHSLRLLVLDQLVNISLFKNVCNSNKMCKVLFERPQNKICNVMQ